VVRALPDEAGHWYVVRSPLTGELNSHILEQVARYWPDPASPVFTDGLAEQARAYHQDTDKAVILTLPIGCIHTAQWLRGFDTWLMDLVSDPPLSKYFLDLLYERWLEVTRRLIEAVGENIDLVFYAEDIAIHQGPLVSPRTYRTIIQPYQQRVFQSIHDLTPARIIYHNCGSVTWQIPDLVEWGVDALNPVQVNSHDMGDTASLKQRFGDRIAFWGGVDTSQVMPTGTPREVAGEVHQRIKDLDHSGGYILASVHNLQADVPPENICSMWETADQIASER
jgi:uroporphyrinogen decarboxylase